MEGLNGNYSGNYLRHLAFFEIKESGAGDSAEVG